MNLDNVPDKSLLVSSEASSLDGTNEEGIREVLSELKTQSELIAQRTLSRPPLLFPTPSQFTDLKASQLTSQDYFYSSIAALNGGDRKQLRHKETQRLIKKDLKQSEKQKCVSYVELQKLKKKVKENIKHQLSATVRENLEAEIMQYARRKRPFEKVCQFVFRIKKEDENKFPHLDDLKKRYEAFLHLKMDFASLDDFLGGPERFRELVKQDSSFPPDERIDINSTAQVDETLEEGMGFLGFEADDEEYDVEETEKISSSNRKEKEEATLSPNQMVRLSEIENLLNQLNQELNDKQKLNATNLLKLISQKMNSLPEPPTSSTEKEALINLNIIKRILLDAMKERREGQVQVFTDGVINQDFHSLLDSLTAYQADLIDEDYDKICLLLKEQKRHTFARFGMLYGHYASFINCVNRLGIF